MPGQPAASLGVVLAAAMLGTAPAAGAAPPAPAPFSLYRVTEQGGGLGLWIDDSVVVTAPWRNPSHWQAELRASKKYWCGVKSPTGQCVETTTTRHARIDGDKCPALSAVFQRLAAMPAASFAAPDARLTVMVSDSSYVEVTGFAAPENGPGAKVTVGGYSGPIRAWWTKSQQDLEHCWVPVEEPAQ